MTDTRWGRRDFMRLSAQAAGALSLGQSADVLGADKLDAIQPHGALCESPHSFDGTYEGARLNEIAFPMGGMGAGMICLEGTGALSKVSLRNRPDLVSEPRVFAAVSVKAPQRAARVLEGPVPGWKLRPQFSTNGPLPTGCWGLPRFHQAAFEARFPFATVHLKDEEMPLEVELTGWSPFSPGDSDNASLPVAGLEYAFINRSSVPAEAVFSFNAENFLAEPRDLFSPNFKSLDRVRPMTGGFLLYGPGTEDRPWDEGYFAAWVDDPGVKVNHLWFRGEWADSLQMVWNDIKSGACYTRDPLADDSSPGASVFVPFTLSPGETKTITLNLAWYVPKSNVFAPDMGFKDGKPVRYARAGQTYQPWYAGRFSGIDDVISYWHSHYRPLRQAAENFTRAFYDSTLPSEAIEAVAANLTILKSPTILRQTDGRLWGFDGCYESVGSGTGGTNGVWNYAQAIAHLFPNLERSLRETEFGPNQDEEGRQSGWSALPIRPLKEQEISGAVGAADSQLGAITKVYRDWRISGDTAWLGGLWPRIRASLDYCIKTWDPEHRGSIEEPHATTYDVEFWGADSMCNSLYLGALKAAILMGTAFGESVEKYSELLDRCLRRMERELFNGEYFVQKIEWKNLRKTFALTDSMWAKLFPVSSEALQLSRREGPPYQYGQGCFSDGVLGCWLCLVCGVSDVLDARKVESHLIAIHKYNLKKELVDSANVFRPFFAFGEDSGLLLCTWPRGGEPSLPLFYANEVWVGVEYEVASHLIALGKIEQGLEIVRSCQNRYDGRVRNPFDAVEQGHWYARALSSYALLQAFSGARFDAVDKILYLKPAIKGDFRCFLSTATGYGTVGVKDGQPFVEVVSGQIPYTTIQYTPA